MRLEKCTASTGLSYYKFYAAYGARVDIFYTDAVRFDPNELFDIKAIGPGTSNKLGIKNRRFCKICNIYRK
jgi:urease beta subunit